MLGFAVDGIDRGETREAAFVNVREAIGQCLDTSGAGWGLPQVVETPAIIAREIQKCLQDRADEGLPLTIETHETISPSMSSTRSSSVSTPA